MDHAGASRRIVAELKRQVTTGALAPGARAPSTRAVSRRFRVAHATAAKALAALCQEGVLVAMPRVGHVVAPRLAPAEEGLGRAKIVRAATAIADAQGVDALSMRAVAAALSAPPMSLYRHVQSKAELVAAMVNAAFGELELPPPARSWREGLEVSARGLWTLYKRHPWLAHVMTVTRPLTQPNVVAFADWIFQALEGLGVDARERLELHLLVFSYVRGVGVDLEAERRAEAESGVDEEHWNEAQAPVFAELARAANHASFSSVLRDLGEGFDLSLDALFESGLAALLDGIERRLSAPWPAGSRATLWSQPKRRRPR